MTGKGKMNIEKEIKLLNYEVIVIYFYELEIEIKNLMINGNSNVLYLLYIFNGIPCIFIHFKIVLSIFSFEKEKSTYFKNVFENL